MAINYATLENILFESLLKHLPEKRYIDLNYSFLIDMIGTTSVHVNYSFDESIWFFRAEGINSSEKTYFFGLKDEEDIKLILKFSKYDSKSFINFFNSKMIAIKVKFTKEGAEIFNSMKKIFEIKIPAQKIVKYNYIMLSDYGSGFIQEITKLIKIADFSYGNEYLLIKGFKEGMPEDYLNTLTSDKDLIMERKHAIERYISQTESYEYSIENIISKIDCTAFTGESFDNDGLVNEFDTFVKSPIFDFVSEGLDDDESSELIICIKEDISNEKISGKVIDISEFYFEQYKSIKKQFALNRFLNEYLKSDDFNKLLDTYDSYGEDIVFEIINHVREDIHDDHSMDNDMIILKVEYYFKAETNKNDYYNQIDKIKADSEYYKNEYNLTNEEFDEILNYIQTKISEGYHIKNINNCLINKINEKVDSNREESRLKLKKLLNNPEFIEKNNITQQQLNQLSEDIGLLIYRNKIRSIDIDEDFLIRRVNPFAL